MSARCCLTPPTYRSDVAKIHQFLKASETSGPHYLKYQEIQPGLQSWSLWAERPLEWSATQLWTQNPPAGSVCSQPINIYKLIRCRTNLLETKLIQQEVLAKSTSEIVNLRKKLPRDDQGDVFIDNGFDEGLQSLDQFVLTKCEDGVKHLWMSSIYLNLLKQWGITCLYFSARSLWLPPEVERVANCCRNWAISLHSTLSATHHSHYHTIIMQAPAWLFTVRPRITTIVSEPKKSSSPSITFGTWTSLACNIWSLDLYSTARSLLHFLYFDRLLWPWVNLPLHSSCQQFQLGRPRLLRRLARLNFN